MTTNLSTPLYINYSEKLNIYEVLTVAFALKRPLPFNVSPLACLPSPSQLNFGCLLVVGDGGEVVAGAGAIVEGYCFSIFQN